MGYFHTKASDCERNDHEESPTAVMHLGYTVIPLVSTILVNNKVDAGTLCKKKHTRKRNGHRDQLINKQKKIIFQTG